MQIEKILTHKVWTFRDIYITLQLKSIPRILKLIPLMLGFNANQNYQIWKNLEQFIS